MCGYLCQLVNSQISRACYLWAGQSCILEAASSTIPQSSAPHLLFLKWAFKVLNGIELLSNKYLQSN